MMKALMVIAILLAVVLAIYWLIILFKELVTKIVSEKLAIENKKLAEQQIMLQKQMTDFEFNKKMLAQEYQKKLEDTLEKKEELSRLLQQANAKITTLEQRISKSQHELYCARQRSKKLVKQARNVL